MGAFFLVMFYSGGLVHAYGLERAAGTNMFVAAMDALFWPMGLGAGIAQAFYIVCRNRKCIGVMGQNK